MAASFTLVVEGVSINADCGTDSDQSTDGDLSAEIRVLVIGMAGHGKSTVCNILLGESQFKVVDTPDVTICNMEDEVSMWKAMTAPNPHVILLAVRCNERYTQKEYDVYLTIKRLWGDSLCERLVVAFTFGDKLEDPDRLDRDCKENERLKKVLKDASKRYVVFKL
nr:hypothetical protein BaRGS_027899 [Batillaria attramentaria]